MTGDELRAARESIGLGPPAMARACGVNRTHYLAWEAGRKKMSPLAVRVVELLLAHPRTARRLARAA
jgi:DNA-binding transcriptional regulator YiaG